MTLQQYADVDAIIKNKTPPVTCIMEHVYIEDCEKFSFIVYLITPMVVFAIVVRITYGWKAKKSIKANKPAQYF